MQRSESHTEDAGDAPEVNRKVFLEQQKKIPSYAYERWSDGRAPGLPDLLDVG